MKKILLIISFIISGMCYAFDNNSAQFPTAQMQSVNNMPSSVSYHSNITPVGAMTVSNSYNPSYSPRRTESNVNPGTDGGEPNLTPIGDPPPFMFIFLMTIYLTYIIRKYGRA